MRNPTVPRHIYLPEGAITERPRGPFPLLRERPKAAAVEEAVLHLGDDPPPIYSYHEYALYRIRKYVPLRVALH